MDMKLRKRANISHKKIIFILSIFLLTIMTVGFAYLEARLSINGNITIANDMWNVHFENLSIDSGSATASKPATISADGRKITFAVRLSKKTDYYQFETDIVNNGELDAMVSDAKISGLPESLKSFMEYTLTYADGEAINPNDALPIGSTERILVNLKFKDGADLSKLPIEENFDLTLDVPYIQATEDAVDRHPTPTGPTGLQYLRDKHTWVPDAALSWTDTGAAGKAGYYYVTETYQDAYPIYFFRGAVTDNNIIFADVCWKIVRTTETGGVKLIYSGKPTSAGACPEKITPYTVTAISGDTSDDNASFYMYNGNNSIMKKIMDDFYVGYIQEKGYDDYVEDTIWCNDFSDGSTMGYGAYDRLITESKPTVIYDKACPNKSDRYTVSDTARGNGKLTYPVGMLTADEMAMAGMGNVGYSESSYLYGLKTTISEIYGSLPKINTGFWTMTPGIYTSNENYHFGWQSNGDKIISSRPYAMNPVISLSSRAFIESGDGTISSPYTTSVSKTASNATEAKIVKILGNDKSAYLDNVASQYVKSVGGIDFSQISSNSNGRGLYIYADTVGTEYPIYYYRGNVTDNNVIFAGYCWKIVRTTETGGTKMIYNGIPNDGKCNNSGTASQLETTSQLSGAYASESNGTITSSSVKTVIDSWYSTNMTAYSNKLEDAVWCNNSSVIASNVYSSTYNPSTSYTNQYYGAVENLYINKVPVIKDSEVCPNLVDRNTTKTGKNNGNKLLDYPVGLLTADEVVLAGAVDEAENSMYYLYTGQVWSTMTPFKSIYYYRRYKINGTASWETSTSRYVMTVATTGKLDHSTLGYSYWKNDSSIARNGSYPIGVRPAISLAVGAKAIMGDGTESNPYLVV